MVRMSITRHVWQAGQQTSSHGIPAVIAARMVGSGPRRVHQVEASPDLVNGGGGNGMAPLMLAIYTRRAEIVR